jgi:hypothetical protein
VSQAKPATVRFYFDADVLGLAKVIASLRADATYPGDPGATIHRRARPACPITTPATSDSEWIPDVAKRGWLIVTRDNRIQERRAEVAAVRENDARLVALSGREATGVWAQLEILMSQWRRIEALLDVPAPHIWAAHRSGLRAVSLD